MSEAGNNTAAAATAAKAKAPAPAEKERFIPAMESRFATSAEFTFPLSSYIPIAGTPFEHVLRPEYWANLKALKPCVRIFVMPEDEKWWAELLVRRTGQGFASVQVLHKGELEQVAYDPKLTKEYDIEFVGPVLKHRVVRKSDGHVLKDRLETPEAAQAWLRDHLRAIAA